MYLKYGIIYCSNFITIKPLSDVERKKRIFVENKRQ